MSTPLFSGVQMMETDNGTACCPECEQWEFVSSYAEGILFLTYHAQKHIRESV